MKKSIIRAIVLAATAAAVLIGCTDVSDVTGGQVDEFLTTFEDAPAVPLASITAVYNQTGTVYPDARLNDLKAGLTVTARYVDNTTRVIPASEYSLSGALNVGTSTITVTYKEKTATFTVRVTLPDIPSAPLVRISAVYDSTEAVYSGATLDDLKKNLVVTAHYGDSTTRVLGATEYELSGTLSFPSALIPSSVITVTYEGRTTTFNVTMSIRDASASLYAKAPPISASDSPVNLSLTSGANILEKAFNYVNSNPGTYTLVLESDIEVTENSVSLTQSNIKLTIIGLGTERTIRCLSWLSSKITFNLGGTGNTSDLELVSRKTHLL